MIKAPVIGLDIFSGLFFKSKKAAIGIPKLETGPQKCVVKMYRNDGFENKLFLILLIRKTILTCFDKS